MSQVQYDAENPFEEPNEQPPPPLPPKSTTASATPPLPPKVSSSAVVPPLPPKATMSSGSSSTTTNYPLTTFNSNANTNVDPTLMHKAERLRQKELELNQREQALDSKAVTISQLQQQGRNYRAPNWPPFRPIVYQNIAGDIPSEVQYLVKRAYWGFLFSAWCLLWNVVCMCTALAIFGSGQAIGDMILSFVYFFFLNAIWFWIYRLIYKAARKSQSSTYLGYLFMMFWVVLSNAFFAVGVPGTGAGGFIYMIKCFEKNIAAGCILIIGCAFWVMIGLWNAYGWIWARSEYSKNGGLEKAKKEASRAAIEEAKNNPDLVMEGARIAANNPDLVMQGVKSAV
mmetsp:Transcript_5823/g.8152  ORF Transcript_5823/g.8152 Transcript_5823/m.8152 type:complete len:341 (-) Transcript_5823:51-1073(-)|eukprot:CAMPEP_0168562200 /NCGR_PEP_ID=MMETSP0413-20121227/11996_1 /TAXON_ID=136452 /ORGANISM="Filamoeba nolandi, Strain NC-AS-23-1" /LENGTH=340 /DNA_ID=CAMNT_0008593611 /DNA_START=71 /DNA_END=1093 /DNA_ORIENTATION=+